MIHLIHMIQKHRHGRAIVAVLLVAATLGLAVGLIQVLDR